MGIGRIIFKTTGFMTKRFRLNTCAELGEFLTNNSIKNGTPPSVEDVSLFLEQTLGSKKMKHIKVTGDKNILSDFLQNEMGMTKDTATYCSDHALSSAMVSPLTRNALLDLRIADMSGSKATNTAVHETQHLLKRTSAIDTRLGLLYSKIRGKKYTEKFVQKYSDILNKKNMLMQCNLISGLHFNDAAGGFVNGEAIDVILSKTGCKDIKQLREYIRKMIREDILIPGCDERNAKILQAMRLSLKDEANSYKIGGLAEKDYCRAKGIAYSGDTKSETLSRLYDEANKVLKGETRRQRVNNIKRFFGLKPKEYAIEKKLDIQSRTLSKEEFESILSGLSEDEQQHIRQLLFEKA